MRSEQAPTKIRRRDRLEVSSIIRRRTDTHTHHDRSLCTTKVPLKYGGHKLEDNRRSEDLLPRPGHREDRSISGRRFAFFFSRSFSCRGGAMFPLYLLRRRLTPSSLRSPLRDDFPLFFQKPENRYTTRSAAATPGGKKDSKEEHKGVVKLVGPRVDHDVPLVYEGEASSAPRARTELIRKSGPKRGRGVVVGADAKAAKPPPPS